MKTQYTLLTVRMPSELADKLKQEATKQDRSVSAVIRLAISAYLERK